MRRILGLILLLGLLPASASAASVYLDSVTGNNLNTGLSYAQAVATWDKAFYICKANCAAGDSIFIGDGGAPLSTTYATAVGLNVVGFAAPIDGTSGNPFYVQAYRDPSTNRLHQPLFSRTRDSVNVNPVIGCGATGGVGTTDVTFKNLRLVTGGGADLYGTRCTLDTINADFGDTTPGASGNPATVRVGGVDGTLQNSTIACPINSSGYSGGSDSDNFRGVYVDVTTSGFYALNNKISGNAQCPVAFGIKRGAPNVSGTRLQTLIQYNWLENVSGRAFMLEEQSFSGTPDVRVLTIRIRNNVVTSNGGYDTAIAEGRRLTFYHITQGGSAACTSSLPSGSCDMDDIEISNNTVYGLFTCGRLQTIAIGTNGSLWAATGIKYFNNICDLSHDGALTVITPCLHFANNTTAPTVGPLFDFNRYRPLTGSVGFSTNDRSTCSETLATWQGRFGGIEANSLAGATDPLYSGTISFPLSSPAVFKLQASSTYQAGASNTCRAGGVGGGAAMTCGAYTSATVVVGPPTASGTAPEARNFFIR